MSTITLQEAQADLSGIVRRLNADDEVSLTEGGRVVARIVADRAAATPRPGPGPGKGMMTIVADDDDHLRDFAESMP